MPDSNFIDYVKICCRSGSGGAGSTHFIRTRGNPRGGPDGGNGGRGGHIILQGNQQLWTLLHLKYTKHIYANDGESGSSNLKTGANGEDRIIEVPIGTVARDPETGDFLGEITADKQEIILLQGGRGGKGNDHFKSSTFRTPRFSQPGEEGIETWIILELKLLADVGLVGFPNAGKSTLLSVVSAAKPEIADYPFTTLVPNLGMVYYRDYRSFVVADIPGIIEGAAEGKGLGLRFLRHIERNALLLFMIPADTDDVKKEYKILLGELQKFNPELLNKPRILAVSKSDLLDETALQQKKKKLPKNVLSIFISAVANKGIDELKDMIWNSLNNEIIE
jgi:GTP-binding protein